MHCPRKCVSMECQSKSAQEQSNVTDSAKSSIDEYLGDDDDDDNEIAATSETMFIGSLIDLIYSTWIPNSTLLKNLKATLGCVQSYTSKQRKDEPRSVRTKEAYIIKNALIGFLDVWKKTSNANSKYNEQELTRVLTAPENAKLRPLFTDNFISSDTFFDWLRDLKEYIRVHVCTLNDVSRPSEPFTAAAQGSVETLFATNTRDKETDGLCHYITKMENGRLHIASSPGAETGHQLFRIDVYDVHDIKGKEKRHWWKHARMRSQFVTVSPTDRKQRMMKQILDCVADDLMKTPGITREIKNVY